MDKAVILDRDGTLVEDTGYAYKIEDFKLIDKVIDALKLLKDNFKLFIVTNQSGIGRGLFTLEDFEKFNNHLTNIFKK
ncbi:MAG: HAD-IIIA family hydrolase [Nanoarchaeota archaeon]|nr:HAD-IIIA family hydrolase [Nanoarchaeota archaeon]